MKWSPKERKKEIKKEIWTEREINHKQVKPINTNYRQGNCVD